MHMKRVSHASCLISRSLWDHMMMQQSLFLPFLLRNRADLSIVLMMLLHLRQRPPNPARPSLRRTHAKWLSSAGADSCHRITESQDWKWVACLRVRTVEKRHLTLEL